MSNNHYVIDSCSLIDLQRFYPISNFPSLWNNLSKLVKKQLLHIPKEVYNEISVGDDSVKDWVEQQKHIIKEITPMQIRISTEIMENYPTLAKSISYNADPWIIALAYEIINTPQKLMKEFVPSLETDLEIEVIIVTEETLSGNKIKIPLIAQQYDIRCLKILDLIIEEKWIF